MKLYQRRRFLTRKQIQGLPKSLWQTKAKFFTRKFWTWRKLARLIILISGVAIVLAILLFAWYFKDLPKPGELRTHKSTESTILYDRNGKQIYDISGEERRILLTSSQIPDIAKKATVSIEDRKFYSHHGVDFLAIIRGTILKPFTGKGIQGGSTITQQYIKNAILSPKRSIARKIKEVILAWELEFIYSKDEILTLYLNEIPYGGNVYGIEAASQAYYGKSINEGLTLAQIATLAAIPQRPTYLSPYGTHVKSLITRKNLVLEDMVKTGAITQEEADIAKKEAPLEAKDFAKPKDNFPAPHFVMYIKEQLADKYGETSVERGGLRVTTTLDLNMQQMAEEAMNDQAKTLDKVKASNASLVAMDPKNGQILAMVGSVDYFDRDNEGNFNVATAQRQPGSAGKPIVYANLLQKTNYAPGSPLWDVQTDFGKYQPNNFDGKFHGPVSIRKALGNSFNIPAVKALAITGLPSFFDLARDMGITTFDKRKDDLGLSVALGGGEVKLVDLVSAYTVFANNGDKAPTTSLLKIQDSRGKVLDEWEDNKKNVLKPEVAYEINSILSDEEAKRPTFAGLLGVLSVRGKTTAVKTGTTDSYRDAWTIGYTPSLVAGVWAGNNDNSQMNRGGGSTAAAPIWHGFMVKALKDKSDEPFFRPSTISEETIDFLSGKKPTPASGQLIKDIFAPWQVSTKDDDVHILIRVCKSNGNKATNDTPAEEIEERTFGVVRSEKPDNPAWENPVQEWIKTTDLIKAPPAENCNITRTDPAISITNLNNGDQLSGIVTITTNVAWPVNQSGLVDFTVDGTQVAQDTNDPYSATINFNSYANGSHDVAAIAHASGGGTATATVSIRINRDTTPPNDVTQVSLVPGTAIGTALATWTNPGDIDLAAVSIYVSQLPGIKGARLAKVAANPETIQSATITGMVSQVINYVTFVTIDTSGNESFTLTQFTVTPP